jgi:hypothetical protein
MTHTIVSIEHPSPRVLGKLRKGGRVRIMKGEGMNLIVSAERFNPISKSFNKGKAFTIELTPAEIEANMNPPEEVGEMSGTGLFDSIKKGFKKVGKVLKPVAVAVGKEVLPVAKDLAKKGVNELAKYAPEVGATLGSSALSGLALLAGQPELVPMAEVAGSQLGKAGGKALGNLGKKAINKKIDRFDPYHEQRGNAPPSRQNATNMLSSPVGVSNLGSYLAQLSTEDIETELAKRRGGGYSTPFDTSGGRQVLSPYTDAVGSGLGGGLYAQGRGRGIRSRMKGMKESASIGIHGNLLGHGLPPALMSQPYSSNFQMASRLPPAFAPMIKHGGGLYA